MISQAFALDLECAQLCPDQVVLIAGLAQFTCCGVLVFLEALDGLVELLEHDVFCWETVASKIPLAHLGNLLLDSGLLSSTRL